jgi:predicted  nucleic acid-binding Zn-ribbon protein
LVVSAQSSVVLRWIGIVAGIALLAAVVALIAALTHHPEIAELKTLQTTVSRQNSQIQQLNSTVQQLHEKVQTLVAKENISVAKENISQVEALEREMIRLQEELRTLRANQTELEKLLLRIKELEKQLSKVENTTWNSVNEYIKAVPKGWSAEEMAQNLSSRFWVETTIIEKDGVQYLFLRFRCSGPTQWWWVTWKGLVPANQAPVQP